MRIGVYWGYVSMIEGMVARIKAVLRRIEPPSAPLPVTPPAPVPAPPPVTPPGAAPAADRWRFAGWVLDEGARDLRAADGHSVPLTTGEFDLLCVLVHHAGRVLSRDFLLEHTRGRSSGPFDRTIDVQVGRLRRKIEPDPHHPRFIRTAHGGGYLLTSAGASK